MKKKELYILIAIAAAAVIALLVMKQINANNAASGSSVKVQITHAGEVVQEFDPSVDAVYHITGSYGTLDVEVKDGSWHVTNEDCPNHICSKTGWVSVANYQPIICLPNEVVVQIAEQ
jgi:hypothetical protein